MRIKADPVSHLAILIHWLLKTDGPVVELGMGVGSTLVIHELCRDRHAVSYENNIGYFNKFSGFQTDWHDMQYVEQYEDADLEQPWSIAFVDQMPPISRRDSIIRLKDWADYIIVHDTERRHNKSYQTRPLFKDFKYRVSYKAWEPHTTVLSDKYPVI